MGLADLYNICGREESPLVIKFAYFLNSTCDLDFNDQNCCSEFSMPILVTWKKCFCKSFPWPYTVN